MTWSSFEKEKWEKVKQICIACNWQFDKVAAVCNKEFGWSQPQTYQATEQFWRSSLNPDYVNYN